MPFDPDLDEMATTTQRNRGFPKKKPRARKAPPSFPENEGHQQKFSDYEGSPQDEMEDRRGAKRMGVPPEEYEGSPQDEAEDRRGMQKMGKPPGKSPKEGPKDSGGAKGVHVAIMISPMANPPAEHRASVRNSINKAVATAKRRGGGRSSY
jgi:hypothetical protein